MRKTLLVLSTGVAMVMLTSYIIFPEGDRPKIVSNEVITKAIPDDVNAILKASCMDCHATGGKGMAMSKVNFSEWDNYDSSKQAKKAEAICNVLTKGTMPPKAYKESHPQAVLTAEQKEMICKWSEALAETN
jgi:hypothetical protein